MNGDALVVNLRESMFPMVIGESHVSIARSKLTKTDNLPQVFLWVHPRT